ncbi:hypothetical protein MYP_1793 [Sporocytophaga myxococcoides]|uniref:Uncharacterized protein n=1 Tax=Sporocytophaga myxococcoides TaxID=153721 RepID=A0A098LC78_9BACT|nr:hypothetical protein MYP_1793 [Sporocytophaga myxococcoides]
MYPLFTEITGPLAAFRISLSFINFLILCFLFIIIPQRGSFSELIPVIFLAVASLVVLLDVLIQGLFLLFWIFGGLENSWDH